MYSYSIFTCLTVLLVFVCTSAFRIRIPTPAGTTTGWRRVGFIGLTVMGSFICSLVGEVIASMNGAIIGGLIGVALVYIAGITHFLSWLIHLIPERVRNVIALVARIIAVIALVVLFIYVGYVVIHWWFTV